MSSSLLHLFHQPPGRETVRLLEAQLRAGHEVAVVTLAGCGDWKPPEGCDRYRLHLQFHGEDAERLLELIQRCDNATTW